ncbi:MAG: endonuclease/exonuclease/phosphatase family protein [Rhizobiales bacterium]|nr:endonuclease/exonuclease/phosphatase family protein [Hyphomicrobiales bacterium]
MRHSSWPCIRVMTWNVHGALGRNRHFDIARVMELVRAHQPDIVALQEIDSRRAAVDFFYYLRDEFGGFGVDARSIATADGDYGQILLSRWAFLHSEVRDISFQEREPRRAICATVASPFGEMKVVATHLGLSLRERNAQLRLLLEMIGDGPELTVLVGDFNDWIWAGSVRNALKRVLPGRTRHRTFPAWRPLFRLDRIYCRPARSLIQSFVDVHGREVSDHLPVIADLIVPGAGSK